MEQSYTKHALTCLIGIDEKLKCDNDKKSTTRCQQKIKLIYSRMRKLKLFDLLNCHICHLDEGLVFF